MSYLVVHDWKVLAWTIHDLVQENIDFIPPTYLNHYIKACWAIWLNRGPEILPYNPHTYLVISDRKDQTGGYWRNGEINKDPRMSRFNIEYKGNRSSSVSEKFSLIDQIGQLYLRKYGQKFFEAPGFEADDFAGAIYRIFRDRKAPSPRKVFLHTSDRDWSQLVDNSLEIYWANVRNPHPKEVIQERLAHERHVIEHTLYRLSEYITHPSQLPIAKARKGDIGDNLPPGTPVEYFDLCEAHPIHKIENLSLYPDLVRACTETEINTNSHHLELSLKILKRLHLPSPIQL
jgi:hypothetical protein